jgi:hypothetical protein
VELGSGSNEFTAPCFYEKLGRNSTTLSLTRNSDGKIFKRSYPVLVEFVPIKLHFDLSRGSCSQKAFLIYFIHTEPPFFDNYTRILTICQRAVRINSDKVGKNDLT